MVGSGVTIHQGFNSERPFQCLLRADGLKSARDCLYSLHDWNAHDPRTGPAEKVCAPHRVHSYEHDPKAPSYGLEAAEKLGLEPVRVFKTLLASSEKGELLVAVVPVVGSLDLKALAQAAGLKNRDG